MMQLGMKSLLSGARLQSILTRAPDGVGGGHGGAVAVPIISEKSKIMKMTIIISDMIITNIFIFFLARADFSKPVVMEMGLS